MKTSYPNFQDNSVFMRALYAIIDALGMREQLERSSSFYATVEPEGDQLLPLVIRSWILSNDASREPQRYILVAHYYYSHGHLKPYPEFVLTQQGTLFWQRSALEWTFVQPGDTSRDYQLDSWAEILRGTFLSAAIKQKEAGRAGVHLLPEDEVIWSSERIHLAQNERIISKPVRADQQNIVSAINAFIENRDAARTAFIQATYRALRENPEWFYLVCSATGTWHLCAESDLVQANRWKRADSHLLAPASISIRIEPVTDFRKLLYSSLNEEASDIYGGYVTDTRKLPDIARELGYSVTDFIEQEVDWNLENLLDDMRRTRSWYERCYHLVDDETEEGT